MKINITELGLVVSSPSQSYSMFEKDNLTSTIKALFTMIFVLLFGFSHAQNNYEIERSTKPATKKITRETIPYYVDIVMEKDEDNLRKTLLYFNPNADLKKYPPFKYKANMERIKPIKVNAKIPDEIWDLPMRIVNDVKGRDSITLRQLGEDKILVLDFWATWCPPCFESMDKWKYVQPKYANQVQVVGLMLDWDYQAELMIKKMGWDMPQLVGPEVRFLNAYFCGTPITGPSAWIKNDKFIGLTETKADKEKIIKALLRDEVGTIPGFITTEQLKNLLKKQNSNLN